MKKLFFFSMLIIQMVCVGCGSNVQSMLDWTNDDYLFFEKHRQFPEATQKNYVWGDIRFFPNLKRGCDAQQFNLCISASTDHKEWKVRITEAKVDIDGIEMDTLQFGVPIPTNMPSFWFNSDNKAYSSVIKGPSRFELAPRTGDHNANIRISFHAERGNGVATNGTINVTLFPRTKKFIGISNTALQYKTILWRSH